MKSPNKTFDFSNQRIPRSLKPKIQKKLKGLQNLNFLVKKGTNFEDLEITITVKGNEIVTKFLNKGVLETQQIVLVKPKPSPPPVDIEIINAINRIQIRLNSIK